jgi:hypothetical protein
MTDWDEDIDEGPDEADADLLDEDRVELVPCPHCHQAISEFAQQCPYCKTWVTENRAESCLAGRRWWWVVLALAGIAMFVLLYAM